MSTGTAVANPIDAVFRRPDGRTALILYLTAGHPNPQKSRELTPAIAGMADIVEFGIPFSDPVADGPVIQASSQRALSEGTRIEDCFEIAGSATAAVQTPLVFFTYYNPVLRYGLDRFAVSSREAGVSGVIAVDLPPEEAGPLHDALLRENLYLIPLLAPTSTDTRLRAAASIARGFVYCVSRTGVTGFRDSIAGELAPFLQRVGQHTALPRAVGFGISTPDHARAVSEMAEGVVVGTALVDLVERTGGDLDQIEAYVRSLREGMDRGR
ncbi:MAG TPA: tryptophan synthase subunit alpha [Chloroflexota bacterium]|nr:tryptophan synthase subunit alpha [Chloroflexota bacterium]